MTEKEKVRFGFGARRRGFFLGEDRRDRRDRRGPSRVFRRRGCALRSIEGREGTTRASRRCRGRRGKPRDAPFLRDRVETRVRRVARCAPRGPPDNPARHRSPVASRSGGDRASAAGNEEEDALRTWTWKTAPCGRTCGFGRNGGDDARSAPGRKAAPRGGARPMRGCRHRPMKRAVAM